MSGRLEDLIDLRINGPLFDSISDMTNLAFSILSHEGTPLISSGGKTICTSFHLLNHDCAMLCHSEKTKKCKDLLNADSLVHFECHQGLNAVAAPVIIHGFHVANVIACQFLLNAPTQDKIEKFRIQAKKWGFDEDNYIKSLNEVSVIQVERVESILRYIGSFVDSIAEFVISAKKEKDEDLKKSPSVYEDTNHKLAETTNLSKITEANTIPTFAIDSNGKVIYWNKACEFLTGYKSIEMIGTINHKEIFDTSKKPLLFDLVASKASLNEVMMYYADKIRKSPFNHEAYEGNCFFPKIGTKGETLFCTAAPIKDKEGFVTGSICTLQNISDKKLPEQELVQGEQRYRHLFESANDAIFLLGKNHFIDCNKKAIKMLRCQRDYIIGKNPANISPDLQPTGCNSKDLTSTYKETTLNKGRNFFEWRFLRKDGSHVDTEVSATTLVVSGQLCLLAIVRDITERNSLIEALKQRETELDEKNRYLEKVNQALKAALDNRGIEIRAVEQSALINFQKRVKPYLEDMGRIELTPEAKSCLEIIEQNLKDIFTPFSKPLISKYDSFTPTEMKIVDLIMAGRATKEIASILGLSPSSVQWHRKNIREKLELTNKKTGLQSFLKSIS